MKYRMKIKRDGTLEFLGAPPPRLPLHDAKRTRFSEILPVGHVHWLVFRILRRVFGEDGKVAAWTRTWRCRWYCVILQGIRTGQTCISNDRQQLVVWEHDIWFRTGTAGCVSEQLKRRAS